MTEPSSPPPASEGSFNPFDSITEAQWTLYQGKVIAVDTVVGGIATKSDGTLIVGDSQAEVAAIVALENQSRAEPLQVTLLAVPTAADFAALLPDDLPALASTREFLGDVLSDS